MTVSAGSSHSIDVLIGERPGSEFQASLLIEKEGVEYKKGGAGNPILPTFRVTDAKIPDILKDKVPPFDPDGPVWRLEADNKPKSLFDRPR